MGRLATYIAGRASSADKLPGKLPNVSLIDALLPRVISGNNSPRRGEPLGDNDQEQDRSSLRRSVTYTDVTKDNNGKLVMVKHRDKSAGAGSTGGGKGTFQDIKKNAGKGSNGDKSNEKMEGAEDVNELKFSPEEDEKLEKLKADNPSMPWAEIGEALGRPPYEGKQRHAELKKLANPPPGDAKGDSKQNNSNNKQQNNNDRNNNNNNNNKQNKSNKKGGGKGSPQKDWTPAEDAKIRQFLRDGVKVAEMAKQLDGREIGEIGPRIGKLKTEDAGGNKDDGGTKGIPEQNGNGGGGKSKKELKQERKNEKRNEKEKEKESKENDTKKEESKPKTSASKSGSQAGSKAGSKAGSSGGEARFTMGEWMTLQEDDMFSFRELQLLSELITSDAEDSWDGVYSWLRVASLFADRTGRRVHPEDIREKFAAMARD